MSELPVWYLTQAQDYISVLQDAAMYAPEELREITRAQRRSEYALMRIRGGLPPPLPPRPSPADVAAGGRCYLPPPPPPRGMTHRELMSAGSSGGAHPPPPRRLPRKVNSYA
mgnify:CR=1 FL=1|jgi:hypothetical protein